MKMPEEIAEILLSIEQNNQFAVGNDIVFLPNFSETYNELFRNKVYTQNEIAYCELFNEPLLRFASTWAAKEAVYKAVKQLDETLIGWKDIEILREKASGKPSAKLHKHNNDFIISLTISHDGEYVWALALINKHS